jgi:hypothetical protein
MLFLGHVDGFDVYLIPHETGLHALTIVGGIEEWEWDSCLVGFARQSGPWAFGLAEIGRRSLNDTVNLGDILASIH